MQVIPVIDLMAGEVVHARQGARDRYRPIETKLCRGSAPLDVVAGLLSLHPFAALYIADLDAIAGASGHVATIAQIAAAWPGVELWVDAGIGTVAAAQGWLDRGLHPVIGSESQADGSVLRSMSSEPRALVSLDFRGEAFQGPPVLLDDASLWPARVIVMTLARVGAGTGPDLLRLRPVIERAESRAVYAAGGVRDAADLAALAEAGVAGVLVASALHNGALDAAALTA